MYYIRLSEEESISSVKNEKEPNKKTFCKKLANNIKKWVESALKKTKNINFNALSSYGLKHICEDSIGVYVSNQEMIDTLKELGFEMKIIKGTPNYLFNISSIIKRVGYSKRTPPNIEDMESGTNGDISGIWMYAYLHDFNGPITLEHLHF